MSKNENHKLQENNIVQIAGVISSGFEYSHEVFGERFYVTSIIVYRLSGSSDTLPVMVSDRLVDVSNDYVGQNVAITGQFRSYNRHEGDSTRLILSVFAMEVSFNDVAIVDDKSNQIFLDGYICKMPTYRKTPLGREIADMLLAVNRPYGKSDYIPCICWGRNARFAAGLDVGAHLNLRGRIQSRSYRKGLPDGTVEERIAYEASVHKIVIAVDYGEDA